VPAGRATIPAAAIVVGVLDAGVGFTAKTPGAPIIARLMLT